VLVLFLTLDAGSTARTISECNTINHSWTAGKEEVKEEIEK